MSGPGNAHRSESGWWPFRAQTPFFSLLKVQRTIGWRRLLEQLGQVGGRGGKTRSFLLLGLMGLGLIPALAMFFGLAWMVQAAYVAIGQPHASLTLMFLAAQVVCLVFGIGYIVSAFYFDTESKLLVPLPLQPDLIAAARFWRVLGGEYVTIGVLLVPFVIAYALQVGPGLSFWLGIVPVFVLLPVAPLAVSGIVAVLFMRLTAGRASRDVIRALGISVIMLVAVGFSIFMQRYGADSLAGQRPDELMEALSSGRLQLVEMIGRWLPTTVWATNVLTGGSGALLSFVLYVLTAGGALAVLLWLARRFLLAALLEPDVGKGRRRAVTAAELARDLGRTRSPLMACVWREAVLLSRQPLFMINALVGNLMLPVLLVVPMMVNPQMSGMFAEIVPSETVRTGAVLGAYGVLALAATASGLGSTAISREGRLFWISRALPVSPREQAIAKLLWSQVWGLLGALVIAVGAVFLFAFNPAEVALSVVGGLLISWLANGIGLIIDLTRPNLTWTDPQQAMKGNWNALLAMVAMLIITVVIAIVTVVLALLGVPALATVLVLLLLGAWLVTWRLGPVAERQYTELAE